MLARKQKVRERKQSASVTTPLLWLEYDTPPKAHVLKTWSQLVDPIIERSLDHGNSPFIHGLIH
jgi:hypothetical protein